ncbi:TPA: hypothetical protein ACTALY_000091 [Salmonella enterica subsp. enterica serovar Muenchen]|nr:hypothetical protein [Salmonella enterica subsp. enterica serovar Muenchen]HEC8684641.1 hypothetical protein [Salmonella enterica subsp. enterica serovar Oranienburg]HEC9706616.1 hypothetical protein [Salmonella enterica subsp. enterica serovar Muenchen]HED0220306.1 hypothetical protein [Salmonella enterica subsp. enterica serovar Muenchen]
MDGFAQGLLAGFDTVDSAMQRRQELGLRQAALAQQQKNADRNYQLAQDEFGYQKETGDRNYQHTLDREKVGDERWGKEFGLRQAETGTRLAMARQQLAMQKETHDIQMNNAKYLQDMQQWEPHNRVLESLISQGKVQEAREYAKANNMPLTIPIVKMLNDTGYTQSILSGGKKLHSIMSAPDAHKDPMATLNAINDNRDTIAPLLQPEADRVIGQIDPVTGKKIVAAKFNHIAPVPDRKDPNHHSPDEVAVFNRVKYDDGSEAIKPITENRSANPKDPVLRADIYGLLGSTSARVAGAHKIISSPQAGNYDDAIASAYQPQGLSQADIQKQEGNIAASAARGGQDAQKAIEQYRAAIGLPGAKEKLQQSQATDAARTWAGDDPAKQQFMLDALTRMPELFTPGNEKQRDIYFQNYQAKNESTQQKIMDTSASDYANHLRQLRQQQNSDFMYGSD